MERLSRLLVQSVLEPDERAPWPDTHMLANFVTRSTLRLYSFPCGITPGLLMSIVQGRVSDRGLLWRSECAVRSLMLGVNDQKEREAFAILWCLVFGELAGPAWLRNVREPFWNLYGIDEQLMSCSDGTNVFGAYVNLLQGRASVDTMWTQFLKAMLDETELYYGGSGWCPPLHCFSHPVCPELPVYPPPSSREETAPDEAVHGAGTMWRACKIACTCEKHEAGWPIDPALMNHLRSESRQVLQRCRAMFPDA